MTPKSNKLLTTCGKTADPRGSLIKQSRPQLSLWNPHQAVLVGIFAYCLSWSGFARIVPQIHFLQVFSVIG
jgi:hypothetical protein